MAAFIGAALAAASVGQEAAPSPDRALPAVPPIVQHRADSWRTDARFGQALHRRRGPRGPGLSGSVRSARWNHGRGRHHGRDHRGCPVGDRHRRQGGRSDRREAPSPLRPPSGYARRLLGAGPVPLRDGGRSHPAGGRRPRPGRPAPAGRHRRGTLGAAWPPCLQALLELPGPPGGRPGKWPWQPCDCPKDHPVAASTGLAAPGAHPPAARLLAFAAATV